MIATSPKSSWIGLGKQRPLRVMVIGQGGVGKTGNFQFYSIFSVFSVFIRLRPDYNRYPVDFFYKIGRIGFTSGFFSYAISQTLSPSCVIVIVGKPSVFAC